MKALKWIFLFLCIVLIPFHSYAAINKVRPGIIIDNESLDSKLLIENLKKELNAILPGKVQVSDEFVLNSQWSIKKARKNYEDLVKNTDVNIIIAFGILSSSVVIEETRFPKPTMAVGIVEPDVQGLTIQKNNQSNINNLTYILFNQSLKRDLKIFHDVYPYKNVGLIADKNIMSAIVKNPDPIQKLVDKQNASFTIIKLENGINEAIERSNEFDAAFIGHVGRFEGDQKEQLIASLAQKKIPSFGASLNDINLGALASISPEESLIKIVRRIALNVESLVDGVNFSSLPLNLDFEEKLTINIQAAKKIGYSPKFSILEKADVVNEFSDSGVITMTLEQVVQETLEKNMELRISQDDVLIAQENLRLSKSGYFPAASVNATQTVIDEDRAENLLGQQAEYTTSGSAKLEQVLYSDSLNTSIDVDKNVLVAKKESYQSLYMDTIYDAVETYFSVLKAKTNAKIQKQDLELTKKHLSIAKQRQSAGHSGASDVYRWQSSTATATSSLFEATNSYKLSKINLNKIMHRPLADKIMVQDESIHGDLFQIYSNLREYEYIDNPATFEKFVDFLVSLTLKNSHEIKEVEANVASFERQYLNYKRKRYFPTAAVTGDTSHVFDRGGEGSDVSLIDVEDNQWSVVLNLSWPIFTGGSTNINKIKTQKEIKRLKKQRDNLIQNLELNVRSAALNIANKHINLRTSKESTLYAQKSLSLVQDSYAKGKVSITELINAQSDALNTRLKALTAAYDYLISVFNLERATGKYRIFSTDQEKFEYTNNMKSYLKLKSE